MGITKTDTNTSGGRMSRVRRCDACGAIGDEPYLGWLRVTTLCTEKVDEESTSILAAHHKRPLLNFDICGPGCLGELALARIEEMSEARLREEELAHD